jgi:hypothetical protein
MRKLTLSADEEVIETAKRLARREKTSVSAMFARIVRLLGSRRRPLGPITRKVSGVITLPRGKTDREAIEEALLDK